MKGSNDNFRPTPEEKRDIPWLIAAGALTALVAGIGSVYMFANEIAVLVGSNLDWIF